MNVIVSYRKRSAQYLYDNGRMFDFLPIINPHNPKEMKILQTWTNHLAQQDVPFLIESTERKCQDDVVRDNFILWKERRC